MKNKNIYFAIFIIIALGAVYYFFFRTDKDDAKKIKKNSAKVSKPGIFNEGPRHPKDPETPKHPKDPILMNPRYTRNRYHTVVKGDTLWQIAEKYGLEKKEIMKLNPAIKDPNIIRIGQKIRIK